MLAVASQGEKISPAVVEEMEQPGTLALQQCPQPGSPLALLSPSSGSGWGQGLLAGVTCPGFPGPCAAAPLSHPCFPHYRHAVNNGPLHQLCDCCGDPYGQAREALDQTGHSPDLCPGLLARNRSQPAQEPTAAEGLRQAAASLSSGSPSVEASPALPLVRYVNKFSLVLLHSP